MTARRRFALLAVAAAVLSGAPAASANGVPGNLLRARVEVRAVAPGDLARTMHDLASGPRRWIAWTAPLQAGTRRMCCLGCADSADIRSASGTGCRLGRAGPFSSIETADDPIRLEDPSEFRIFVRVSDGGTREVRAFSLDCPIDAEGATVVWLDGVPPGEAVAWLETLLPSKGGHGELPDSASSAVAAIALQPGPEAEAALRRAVASDRPIELRERTAFWMAEARGAAGCAFLEKAVPEDADARFRDHATFALTRCRDDAAVATLLVMARRDPASEVRSRALFWLASAAGKKAASAIDDAIRDDPDTEVKKQAVFALTQMPDDEGVPQLIRVARTNRNPEVRERAVFWLGQSKDPRALDFIEDVLTK